MEGLGVHLLPARTSGPRLPVADDLRRHLDLQLLLQRLVAIGLLVAATDPGDTGEPRADVEVVLAGLSAVDEACRGQDVGEVVLEVADDALPVVDGGVEELGAVGLALVDRQDVAVRGLLLLVEVLEGRAFLRGRVLLKSLLACFRG